MAEAGDKQSNNDYEESYRRLKDGEFSSIDLLDGAIERYATLRGKSVLAAIYEEVDVAKEMKDDYGKEGKDGSEKRRDIGDLNEDSNEESKDSDGIKRKRSHRVKRICGGRNRFYHCSCDVVGKTLVGKSCTFRIRARKKRQGNAWKFDVAAAQAEGTLEHKSTCI